MQFAIVLDSSLAHLNKLPSFKDYQNVYLDIFIICMPCNCIDFMSYVCSGDLWMYFACWEWVQNVRQYQSQTSRHLPLRYRQFAKRVKAGNTYYQVKLEILKPVRNEINLSLQLFLPPIPFQFQKISINGQQHGACSSYMQNGRFIKPKIEN